MQVMSESGMRTGWIGALIRRRPLLLLFLVCFVAWLPGFFTLPPLDRDESRFAQASKQMLETRNFVDIRFGVEPRYKKPVGIYWLQSASTAAVSSATGDTARNHIWTYRIPSLIGAFVAVALCFWCASAFLEVEAAFFGALLLGLTLLLAAEAKIAKTDAVLLATVVGSQAVLLRAYLARDPDKPQLGLRTAMLGWTAFAIGVLIKGPVIFGVCGATVLFLVLWDSEWMWMSRALLVTVLVSLAASVLFKSVVVLVAPWVVMLGLAILYGQWRWLGQLRPIRGVFLTLFLVLPWLLAIWFASHGEFYSQALGHDFGAKLAGGQESHGAPPGYYVLGTTIALWPATLFAIPAVAMAVLRRREPAIRFLLAWATATFLLFELVPTKLPHYVLPAYPALAMLMAAYLVLPKMDETPLWWRRLPIASAVHFLLGVGLLAVGMIVLPGIYGPGPGAIGIAAAGVSAVLGIAAAIFLLRGAKGWALGFVALAALSTFATVTLLTAPRLEQFWVSPREAEVIARHRTANDPPPVLAGYTEPSALFLIGTQTRLTNGLGAAEIGAAQGGLVAVEDGQRPRFLAHLAELEADAVPIDQLSGFNYSHNRPVHITLYRVTPPREITAPPQE